MTLYNAAGFKSFNLEEQQNATKQVYYFKIADLPGGDTLKLAVIVAKGIEDGPTLVALGGVHGDEYEGPYAVRLTYENLNPIAMKGTYIGVPVCNVPAFAAGLRVSPLDGLNLARIFPGNESGTVTERIAYNLGEYVISGSDFLIDLHSSGVGTSIPPLIGYYANNSPLGQQSLDAARAFGMPVMWGHPSLGPGRTISYAHEKGIPWLYTESVGGGWLNKPHALLYARGVSNILKQIGILEGEVEVEARTHHLIGDGDLDSNPQASSVSGYWVSEVEILDRVKKGDKLGSIVGLAGETLEEIIADQGGVVVLLKETPTISIGQNVCAVTQEKKD